MRIFDHKIDALPGIAPGIAHTEPCKHCTEAQQSGRANELPAGWLMQRRLQNASQLANAAATMAVVEEENGEAVYLHQSWWSTVYILAAGSTICAK